MNGLVFFPPIVGLGSVGNKGSFHSHFSKPRIRKGKKTKRNIQKTEPHLPAINLCFPEPEPEPEPDHAQRWKTCFGGFPNTVARVTAALPCVVLCYGPSIVQVGTVSGLSLPAPGRHAAPRLFCFLMRRQSLPAPSVTCLSLKVGRVQTRPLAGDAQPTEHMGQPQNGKRRF